MIPLHGIASRHDLPLPFELVVIGGGIVLLLTFWVAFFAWKRPRYRELQGKELPRLTRFIDSPVASRAARIVVAVLWGLMLVALFLGVDRIDNPAIGFLYVLLWVGLVPLALLFGNVHRRTNPLRLPLIHQGGTAKTPFVHEGSWSPAAAALLAFLYLELVLPNNDTLAVLRAFVVAWMAWVIVGGLLGSARWVERADPFEVYATTMAKLSPWARTRSGVLLFTSPLRNLASWVAPRGLALVTTVLLGGTLFDALSNTAWWVRATQDLGSLYWPVASAGLLASVGTILGLFWLGTRPYGGASMDTFAPGLVPLVAGYALAHYGTMLYLEGQRTIIRMSDPLGKGWNLFGMAEAAPTTGLFAFPTAVAIVQVLLIVGGHTAGVLVTHDIALREAPRSMRVHLPLLLLMVVFTGGGLLLMFGG